MKQEKKIISLSRKHAEDLQLYLIEHNQQTITIIYINKRTHGLRATFSLLPYSGANMWVG